MSRLAAVCALALVLSARSAAAQEPTVIERPEWAKTATDRDLRRLYPQAARESRVEGRAAAECRVTVDGRLTACAVHREEPAGYGFGEATVKLADEFRLKSGTFVEGSILRLAIRWTL